MKNYPVCEGRFCKIAGEIKRFVVVYTPSTQDTKSTYIKLEPSIDYYGGYPLVNDHQVDVRYVNGEIVGNEGKDRKNLTPELKSALQKVVDQYKEMGLL